MVDFLMPSLGADMESGILVEWLVKPGDVVKRGDIVAVVETNKGAIEVEIFQDGVIDSLLVPEGQEVPVGTALARIHGEGEPTAEKAAPPAPIGPQDAIPVGAGAIAPDISPAHDAGRVRASPAARRHAEEAGIALEGISGTGLQGAITLQDVERAARTHAGEPRREHAGPVMQQAIAAAMARSKREIPHYYLGHQIDFQTANDWVCRENERRSVTRRLLPGVLLLKATALALRDFSELNGYWAEGAFRPSDSIHLGVAISLRGGGLVAPALHAADTHSLDALMDSFRDLVKRARSAKLRSSELSDGTITVTSLGEAGVDTVFPVIYPPQVAIVGFGGVVQRAWPIDDGVGVRAIVTASLAGDHRVSNGLRGSQFLRAVESLLQIPEAL